MTKKADLGGKRLISLAPNNWVRWITQNQTLEVREILFSPLIPLKMREKAILKKKYGLK